MKSNSGNRIITQDTKYFNLEIEILHMSVWHDTQSMSIMVNMTLFVKGISRDESKWTVEFPYTVNTEIRKEDLETTFANIEDLVKWAGVFSFVDKLKE